MAAMAHYMCKAATPVVARNAQVFRNLLVGSGATTTSSTTPGFLSLVFRLVIVAQPVEECSIFVVCKEAFCFQFSELIKGFFRIYLLFPYCFMTKRTFKSKWALPFFCGIALTVVGWAYWQKTHPPIDPLFVRLAKETNSNPYDVSDANALLGETGRGELSDERWSRLKELFESPSLEVKTTATAAMMGLDRSRHRGEVIAMVKPLLQNPDWRTQNQALILLRRFDDPSWRAEATKRLTSPDEQIRSNAQVQFRLADAARRTPSSTANGTSR